MLGSAVLDVCIGIVFVFVLVSIICTAVREGLDGWFKTRAAYLHYAIRELLHYRTSPELVGKLFNHPLIYGLFQGKYDPPGDHRKPGALAAGANLPSYIPSHSFALALMDLAARGPQQTGVPAASGSSAISLENIRANVSKLGNPEVERVLLTAIDSAQGDIDKAVKSVEAWYDSAMDRVSGWYRRSTQWVLLSVAVFLAVALNINTISIVHYLSQDETARAALVGEAGKILAAEREKGAPASAGQTQSAGDAASTVTAQRSIGYRQAETVLAAQRLPLGWSQGWGAPERTSDPKDIWNFWAGPLLGWLITAFAAMLGAPFWFDVLNKIMVIRSTVKPHEKSPEESSEDRQTQADRQVRALQSELLKLTVVPMATNAPVARNSLLGSSRNAVEPADRAGEVDACGGDHAVPPTPDEELPAATGGVARK
jgi:hypothetical protein